MWQEKGVYKREHALAVAERLARKFGEPSPHLPKILEFIVFGSAANGTKETVGDLDVLVLADFTKDPKCQFAHLPTRLEEIEAELRREGVALVPVDFAPLLVSFLWDEETRTIYRQLAKDPQLFDTMLSSFLRWDAASGTFKRADRAYLNNKYRPK